MKNKILKSELFRLSKEVWDSLSYDDIVETAISMCDMGIFHPPYRKFDVECDNTIFANFGGARGSEYEYVQNVVKKVVYHYDLDSVNATAENFHMTFHGDTASKDIYPWIVPEEAKGTYRDFYLYVYTALIVVLSSKNIDKKQAINSERSRNHQERKDSKSYSSTTTIRVGKITEYVGNKPEGTGRTVKAHLRRGHIKNVRIGEGRKDTKKVFIHPVFVNADRDWVAPKRESYKLVTHGKKIGL